MDGFRNEVRISFHSIDIYDHGSDFRVTVFYISITDAYSSLLKLLRPLLQPVLSLLLERLYESKQGVLTQLAWMLVAVSKVVQEMLK
jgi:hypothetical protein